MKKKQVRRLELLLHLLTSAILLLKGFDLVQRKLYFPGGIILGLALIVLLIITLWRPLKIKPRQARVTCYYLETPALLVIAYVLHLEQKEFMPYIFFISAILYPAVGFISSKKFKKIRKPAV